MSASPLIAVSACRRTIEPHPFHMAGEKYLDALIQVAGGLPVVLPALGGEGLFDEILGRVDGVFLTGSYSNVEPQHYSGDDSRAATLHDPHRDALTLPLIGQVLQRGMPLFAVCRGFQEVNVALGGTLHPHIEEVAGFNDHRENPADSLDEQYGPAHPVHFVDGGLLRSLAGSSTEMVNSLHSQGVRKLADGVTVEALADDGVVEAFRVDAHPGFALAVQWHPEWRAGENPFYTALFRAFGEACREYAAT